MDSPTITRIPCNILFVICPTGGELLKADREKIEALNTRLGGKTFDLAFKCRSNTATDVADIILQGQIGTEVRQMSELSRRGGRQIGDMQKAFLHTLKVALDEYCQPRIRLLQMQKEINVLIFGTTSELLTRYASELCTDEHSRRACRKATFVPGQCLQISRY